MATLNPRLRLNVTLDADGGKPGKILTRPVRPGRDVMHVRLTNIGGPDLTLTPDGCRIALDLSALLSTAELETVGLAGDGWDLTVNSEPRAATLDLSPTETMTWPARQDIEIRLKLGRAGAGATLDQHPVHATLFGLRGPAPGQIAAPRHVDDFLTLAEAPDTPAHPLRAALSCEATVLSSGVVPAPGGGTTVYSSAGLSEGLKSRVRVTLRNTQAGKALSAAAGRRPEVVVVFPCVPVRPDGDLSVYEGSTAFTTDMKLTETTCRVIGNDGAQWEADKPATDALAWKVRPKPGASEFLKAGAAVEIEIGDLETELPAFATEAYVLVFGLDGVDGGYFTVPLRRELAPPYADFTAQPADIDCGEIITLRWAVQGCERVEITSLQFGQVKPVPSPAMPTGSLEDTPDDLTTFTLTLFKGGLPVLQRQAVVKVAVPTVRLEVSPSGVEPGETATLTWELNGRFAFDGRITDGGTLLSRIAKPAGTPSLAQSAQVRPDRSHVYRLTGRWTVPRPADPKAGFDADATAALALLEPGPGIRFFRMSRGIDRLGDTLEFRWRCRNVTGYRIAHCPADRFDGVTDGLTSRPGERRSLNRVFTMVEAGDEQASGASIRVTDIIFPDWCADDNGNPLEPTVEWFNRQIDARAFYLVAQGTHGADDLVFKAAERVDRSVVLD